MVVSTLGHRRTRRISAVAVEFDTFSVAVGLAIIAGGLALAAPFLEALAAALSALAGAGWAAGRARERASGVPWTLPGRAVGLLSVAVGAGLFFLLPDSLSAARGLALALSLTPMWWIERRRNPGRVLREDGTA